MKSLLYTTNNNTTVSGVQFVKGEIISVKEFNLIVGQEGNVRFTNRTGNYISMKINEFNKKFKLDAEMI